MISQIEIRLLSWVKFIPAICARYDELLKESRSGNVDGRDEVEFEAKDMRRLLDGERIQRILETIGQYERALTIASDGIVEIGDYFVDPCYICETNVHGAVCKLLGLQMHLTVGLKHVDVRSTASPMSNDGVVGRPLPAQFNPLYFEKRLARELALFLHNFDISASNSDVDLPPLTTRQALILDFIRGHGPVTGRQIADGLNISESTLTKHYIPALKDYGVQNRRGAGYFLPST